MKDYSPGTKHGRWTVLSREAHSRFILCRCECGSEKSVDVGNLGKHSRSCGCLRHEQQVARAGIATKHGHCGKGWRTTEYDTWASMIKRCTVPTAQQYPNYGGRGIKVCDEWRKSFQAFLDHIGRKPNPKYTLERKEVNRDYEPGNICWASRKDQARNMRKTIWLSHNGQTRTLPEWAEILGVKYTMLHGRYRKWKDARLVLGTPIQPRSLVA